MGPYPGHAKSMVAAFMDFAAAHNVSPIQNGLSDLEDDRNTLAELDL
jgi:hypothetical protein